MLGEGGTALAELEEAVDKFQAREDRRVDLKGLRVVIDALEAEFSAEARNAQLGRDNLVRKRDCGHLDQPALRHVGDLGRRSPLGDTAYQTDVRGVNTLTRRIGSCTKKFLPHSPMTPGRQLCPPVDLHSLSQPVPQARHLL